MAQGKTVLFYIVGRKGRAAIQRFYAKHIVGQHDTSAMKSPAYQDALNIAEHITERYLAGEFDVVHLAYANFRSALLQEPTVDQIIPVVPRRRPRRPDLLPRPRPNTSPTRKTILAALLPRNVAIQIYRALLENAASEQGSQMTAMDNATRNAGDMINKLSVKYNRQRQAAITTELVEIISGAEAL